MLKTRRESITEDCCYLTWDKRTFCCWRTVVRTLSLAWRSLFSNADTERLWKRDPGDNEPLTGISLFGKPCISWALQEDSNMSTNDRSSDTHLSLNRLTNFHSISSYGMIKVDRNHIHQKGGPLSSLGNSSRFLRTTKNLHISVPGYRKPKVISFNSHSIKVGIPAVGADLQGALLSTHYCRLA